MIASPVVPLTGYQQRWFWDRSRFKHGRWSRQSGKTFGTTLEIADEMHAHKNKWVILSRGERQSKENMEQLATHCRAYGYAADLIEDRWRGEDSDYRSLEIRLPNGSRALGLPANPDTARGHSAHLYLDEFAFHADSRKIWAALFPVVTRGYRIIVTSTPQGKLNKFYELEANPQFSKHRVDIFSAVADGLVLRDETGATTTPEALRVALGDEDAWRQEYLVEYLDEATAYLTYELIAACESEQASIDDAADWEPTGSLFVGVDIGRKRDLTVIWVLEQVGDVVWTRRVIALDKAPFSTQREVLWPWLQRAHRAAIDETGLGMQMAEEARKKFGTKVEPVTFTLQRKEALSVELRRRFEDRTLRIPVDRVIREDLHRIKRLPSTTGHFRFDAERNDQGHADRYWALALAVGAGSMGVVPRIRGFATAPSGEISAGGGA